MGHITSMVLDAAEIWAYECLLPDDWSVLQVASRIAELAKLPSVGSDNYPISYGLVQLRGSAIDPQSRLTDLDLPDHPVFRIVPDITAAQETMDFAFDENNVLERDPVQHSDVKILNQRLITEDVRLDLKVDVRIDAAVHRQIEDFASKDRHTECAGLLLGTVTDEEHERAIHIKAVLPAYDAKGSRTSVKIDLQAWDQILLDRDKCYGDLDVLGWFHTHAGWGVFMSDADVFIHRHFFRHPNMVAYVLDPTMGKDGFFYWHDGTIGLCPNYGLVGAASAVRRQSKGKRRVGHTLRNIIIGIIMAAALCMAAIRLPISNKIISGVNPSHEAYVVQQKPHVKPMEIKTQAYTLQRGDTLWSVCRKFYGNAKFAYSLAEYNKIDEMKSLQVGREIIIPPKGELEAR
ncbi:LysM peptidoglycan-binding domain-containing protein [bacterium]|nr:LysM peptidoglycan-binding domain-containing protein [bacterium]